MKQTKQMIQIEHNMFRNPNWPEANQLAIYKRGRGFELGITSEQIQPAVRAWLELGVSGLQVLQSVTILLQSATAITKCDYYYKVRQYALTTRSL